MKRAFITGIDPKNLDADYRINGENTDHLIDAQLLDLLLVSFELAQGREVLLRLPGMYSYNPDLRTFIYIPSAEVFKYQVLKERNRRQAEYIDSAA